MSAPVAVTVTASSSEILATNGARAGYFIQNPSNSGATVWVRPDGGVASMAPPCFELQPGGFLSLPGIGSVTAIASSPTTITVMER